MPSLFARNQTINIIAKSRENTYFDGPALGLSSINDSGPFDILPQHANFICLIAKYFVILKPDGSKQNFDITGQALMRVYRNTIYIYLGVSPPKDSENKNI